MTVTVSRRSGPTSRTIDGLVLLEQQFAFAGATPERLAELLWTAKLCGDESIMGSKANQGTESDATSRRIKGFVPAPGFRFDVEVRRIDGDDTGFVVHFAQPERSVPYLQGGLVWRFLDGEGAEQPTAIFDEQINTPLALKHVNEPLHGAKASLRRWAFFKVGHAQVMAAMVKNLAELAAAS